LVQINSFLNYSKYVFYFHGPMVKIPNPATKVSGLTTSDMLYALIFAHDIF